MIDYFFHPVVVVVVVRAKSLIMIVTNKQKKDRKWKKTVRLVMKNNFQFLIHIDCFIYLG